MMRITTAIATAIGLLCALLVSPAAFAQDRHQDGLVAKDGQYLGCVSCSRFDPDSVRNPYGRYGSRYSPTSINNPYSRYGSPYASESARNPYTQTAPEVQHKYFGLRDGALSANPYHFNHLRTTDPYLWENVNDDLQIIPDHDADPYGFTDPFE